MGGICPHRACQGSVWKCCLVKVRRPGPNVIVIQPPAAVTGSNFFVIEKSPAELVGMGQYTHGITEPKLRSYSIADSR